MSAAILYALLSLFFAGINDLVFKRYAARERSRGMLVFTIGCVWGGLQLVLLQASGPALTFEARCEGLISDQPRGPNGFGYDPVFYYPPLKKTFAQLTMVQKNEASHRGQALRELKNEFEKVIVWLGIHMPA